MLEFVSLYKNNKQIIYFIHRIHNLQTHLFPNREIWKCFWDEIDFSLN